MTWPWFTCEVDYEFFTFPTFRKKYWPLFQLFVLFFYILPTLYYSIEKIEKQQDTKGIVCLTKSSRPRLNNVGLQKRERKEKHRSRLKIAKPQLRPDYKTADEYQIAIVGRINK